MENHSYRFPSWFLTEYLSGIGWPRKKGFIFKQNIIDATVLYVGVNEMARIAMGIGAGLPKRAIQLIYDVYQGRDWKSKTGNDLVQGLEASLSNIFKSSDLLSEKIFPWHMISAHNTAFFWRQLGFGNSFMMIENDYDELFQKSVKADALYDGGFLSDMARVLVDGLFFGIRSPEQFVEELERERLSYSNSSSSYPWKSNQELFKNCDQFIMAFETVYNPLPGIPSFLSDIPIFTNRLNVE